jgi:hypothetical protein
MMRTEIDSGLLIKMSDKNLTDLGDRLNALREEYLKTELLTPYHTLDLGVKMIMAAALLELVKIGRENQKI